MKEVGEKRAASPLELRHMIWILDWARVHCAESIEKMELELVRHNYFADSPASTQWGYKARSKEEERLTDALKTYRMIYDWLDGAKNQAMNKSAEEFAQDMAEMFRRKK